MEAPAEVDVPAEERWVTQACKNHPNLRWVRKNPAAMAGMISRNPQLMFRGEITENGAFKEGGAFTVNPFHTLKCRIEGVNPYDTSLKDEEGQITSWDEVLQFVHAMEELGEKYAFECDCPATDLYTIGPSQ
jgi:hypothetical protein